MMTRLAVFRCDADANIGFGHLIRCLALAEGLCNEGWTCAFAVSTDTAKCLPTAARSQRIFILPFDQHAAAMAKEFGKCELLIVDHYRLGKAFESECRSWAEKILVIDDLADRDHDCDFLLDQTLGRVADNYRDKVSSSCKMLLGPDYALLRQQFPAVRFLSPRPLRQHLSNVLVSLGGSAPQEYEDKVLDGISNSDMLIQTRLISGFVPAVVEPRPHLSRLFAVEDMANLMLEADLAIGAAGSSSWERCCLGVPSLLGVSANNQKEIASRLATAGAAILIGEWSTVTVNEIAAHLRTLADPTRLGALSAAAAGICDGLGVGRILLAIDPPRTYKGVEIGLRRALHGDCDLILAWQNEPEARRYSHNPEIPDSASHACWFMEKLRTPTTAFHLIQVGEETVGMLRVDLNTKYELQVSFFVSAGFRYCGLGSAAISTLPRLFPWARFYAEAHVENLASAKALMRGGFQRTGDSSFEIAPKFSKVMGQ